MNRIVFIIGIALALIAAGCGSDNPQPAKASTAPPPVTPVAVEQPKPSPLTPVEPPPVPATPSSIKPKPPSLHRARHGAQAVKQVAPGAVEDSASVKLANEILNLPLQERLEWSKQEFAKRGINVYDHQ